MNRYEPPFPRVAFGFAAVAMTAITIGVLVVLPSKMEPESQEFALLRAASVRQRSHRLSLYPAFAPGTRA